MAKVWIVTWGNVALRVTTAHQKTSMATFSQSQSLVDQYDSSDLDKNKIFEELISEYNEVDTLIANQPNTSNICNTDDE